MRKNNNHKEIDTLDFEVKNQELSGKSGSGWFTAVQLTLEDVVDVGLQDLMNVHQIM